MHQLSPIHNRARQQSRGKRVIVCAACGEQKIHEARGLCKACYCKLPSQKPSRLRAVLNWNKRHPNHSKEYYLANIERAKEYSRTRWPQIKDRERPKRASYQRNRRCTDTTFRLAGNMRTRIWHALKGMAKTQITNALIGCTTEALWDHLESQFLPGMTRYNYGLWHVDHIKPVTAFDLPKEQKLAFHYTNLQPLWAGDNRRKSNKIG